MKLVEDNLAVKEIQHHQEQGYYKHVHFVPQARDLQALDQTK